MYILYIISAGILILLFLLAGVFKLIQTREKIMASGGSWAEDVSAANIKIVGMAEVILGLSLLASLLLTIIFAISPIIVIISSLIATISSIGMALIMLAAAVLHIKRKEYGFVAITLLLTVMALSIFIASLKF